MFAVFAVGLLAAVGVGCGELTRAEGAACDQASDCLYPAVCCTQPRIPAFGAPIPLCESIRSCDAYLAFLPEGSPCERTRDPPSGQRALEQCADGLRCCPASRTCKTEDGCAATPEAAPTQSSARPCAGDPDCRVGEICTDINVRKRDGVCRALVEAPPTPDGGA